MDLCAEMLLRELGPGPVQATCLCPPYQRGPGVLVRGRPRLARNVDRSWNRYWVYPRFLQRRTRRFHFYHVVDHSYAHLVHFLPRGFSGVYCHDLDAFRCLFEPQTERRPRWFRALARNALAGLRKAAVVFYSTALVAGELLRHGVLGQERLVHAPYGVALEFLTELPPENDLPPAARASEPYLLHVGSCIPRKRVDLLLEVFAALSTTFPELRLVKVGGEWSDVHAAIVRRHRLADRIVHLRGLGRRALAALYRRAALVLLPSDAEGFGLPVIEALACGAPVLASDLPSTREAGGEAAVYAPPGDLLAWTAAAGRILRSPTQAPPRESRQARGRQFTWARHAATIADAYLRLAG
jgi:glycosyltransferase involved in cell wall biosynthesis